MGAEQKTSDGPTVRRYIVARAADIAEGERLIVEVADREIGIFRVDGEYYALRHRCPHLGGPLCQGEIIGLIESSGPGNLSLDPSRRMLTCPWHGWEFDIKTGNSYWNPQRAKARRFPVELETGAALKAEADGRIPGPYVAEMMPISIEDDYIVVTLRGAASHRDREAV